MLLIRKNGVTTSDTIPHGPGNSVVSDACQKNLCMHCLHRLPRYVLPKRTTSAPMFWWYSAYFVGASSPQPWHRIPPLMAIPPRLTCRRDSAPDYRFNVRTHS